MIVFLRTLELEEHPKNIDNQQKNIDEELKMVLLTWNEG